MKIYYMPIFDDPVQLPNLAFDCSVFINFILSFVILLTIGGFCV